MVTRVCRRQGCTNPALPREAYCCNQHRWQEWNAREEARAAARRKPPVECRRERCHVVVAPPHCYCSDVCRDAVLNEREEQRKADYRQAHPPPTCRRPGCEEPRAPGRGKQLCERHGRTADLIASQRVPAHTFAFRGRDLVVTCPRCGSQEVIATQPTPKEAKAARQRAQVWACEHTCQEVAIPC